MALIVGSAAVASGMSPLVEGALYADDAQILGEPHEPKPGILAGLEVHPIFP